MFAAEIDHCGIDGEKLVYSPEDPLVGRTIDRYRVVERLGVGAMGSVYRVVHQFLGREYAMKVLFGDLGANKRVVERFRREALASSQMRHPNIVTISDFGTDANGLTFLVMEYLEGQTLAHVIDREAPLPPVRAANIGRQIASGLAEAHRLSFVHRDVKPANVMLLHHDGHEYVKLLDFGIVGVVEDLSEARITATGQFVGTPLYMAPEQARDLGTVHPTADIYSLGVILYEMLTGVPPFDADGLVDVLLKHTLEPIPPIPESGGLEHLVTWMLAKRTEERPQTADEVVQEIDRLLENKVSFPVEFTPGGAHPNYTVLRTADLLARHQETAEARPIPDDLEDHIETEIADPATPDLPSPTPEDKAL